LAELKCRKSDGTHVRGKLFPGNLGAILPTILNRYLISLMILALPLIPYSYSFQYQISLEVPVLAPCCSVFSWSTCARRIATSWIASLTPEHFSDGRKNSERNLDFDYPQLGVCLTFNISSINSSGQLLGPLQLFCFHLTTCGDCQQLNCPARLAPHRQSRALWRRT
jgi:hypothetical protein